MAMHRWILVIGLAVVAVAGYAGWQQWGPLPDSVAARVDGDVIPAATLDVFVAAARRSEPDISRESVLKGLVENRLLAAVAHTRHDHHAHPERVGYDSVTRHEQQRFKLIRTAYADALRQAANDDGMGNSLDSLTTSLALSREALAPMLTLEQALYSTMTDAQQQAASHYVLARYRFADDQPEQTLTLWDLYRRQNIQLKVQMHNLNLGFIREAVKQQLTMAYVFYWFEQQAGLSRAAIAAVDRSIDDALQRDALMHDMGLMQDIHDDNPELRELAAQVSDAQLADYYAANKEQFTCVERVRARHLRVNSQQQADRVHELIHDGLSFDQAVADYSVAPDRDQGGELGWIDRQSRQDHWTRALAFVQPEGAVSPPFRSPGADAASYWELFLVEEKVTAYQSLESESVRYRAGRAVAQQLLQQRFQNLLAQVTEQASLRINQEVL
ncbi:MAG: peptidylprolyl isomerase [Alcanivorax jadensis]|uniref:peptidylprolyl isomerase n=1 Tax=Alcanivorax jadensis TaxID=64988 RepID=UPI003001C2FA